MEAVSDGACGSAGVDGDMLSEDRDRATSVTGICRLGGLRCRKMELELLVLTE